MIKFLDQLKTHFAPLLAVSVLAVGIIFLVPQATSAQQFVTCSGTDCGTCELTDLVNEIIQWLLAIFFILFAGLMTFAGFKLVTSGGNTSALEAAKGHLTNGLIGLVIILSAWLIVDTVMKGLVGGGSTGVAKGEIVGWGPWSEIKCSEQVETRAGSLTGTSTPPTSAVPAGSLDNFVFQQGIRNQIPHASPRLRSLLECMATKMPKEAAQVSSISDNRIVSGSATFDSCARNGGCAHSRNSCHYGGRSCIGQSFAVDFAQIRNANAVLTAAGACGADGFFWGDAAHTRHMHISVGRSCGCDAGARTDFPR